MFMLILMSRENQAHSQGLSKRVYTLKNNFCNAIYFNYIGLSRDINDPRLCRSFVRLLQYIQQDCLFTLLNMHT